MATNTATARTRARKSEPLLEEVDIWFKVGDDLYHVSPMDLTGLDERRIRAMTGLPFALLASQFGSAPGIDTLGAMIWIAKVQQGHPATEAAFEEVLASVNYGTEIEMFDGKPDEAVASPEA